MQANAVKAPCPNREPRQNQDGTWSIPLTRGKVAIVDDCDIERVRSRNWYAKFQKPRHWYAMSSISKHEKVMLHRLITSAPEHMFVDHADGDGLNNRRCNVRICTNSQNQANRRPQKNQTGFKGVRSAGSKFIAAIRFYGRSYTLGYFTTAIEAARAYDKAARIYFDEFASTNF